MRECKFVIALLALLCSLLIAPGVASSGQSRPESELILEALAAAFVAAESAHLEVDGKVIRIRSSKHRVHISFLKPEGSLEYGGQAHVAFDIESKSVVEIAIDD